MEERGKAFDQKKSAPLFDSEDSWRLMETMMRREDWKEINERMAAISAQNTNALIEIFQLGFRSGVRFAQDTYEKERQN